MSSIFTPTTHTGPPEIDREVRSAPPEVVQPIRVGPAAVVVVGAFGLGIALVAGATAVFNVLVFVLFALLWLSFAAALAKSPGTLDETWHQIRALPLAIQGIAWLLFLPLTIGLWIWERDWSMLVRLVLVVGIAFANIVMFLPKGP